MCPHLPEWQARAEVYTKPMTAVACGVSRQQSGHCALRYQKCWLGCKQWKVGHAGQDVRVQDAEDHNFLQSWSWYHLSLCF